MRTHRLFVEEIPQPGEELRLSSDQTHLLARVLRLGPGQALELLNGQGSIANGVVADLGREKGTVEIREEHSFPRSHPYLELLASLPKGEKSDWIVQKSVEWGVNRIQFFSSEHSVKKGSNRRRWEKIAQEALRQSGNPWLPEIGEVVSLQSILSQIDSGPLAVWFDLSASHPSLVKLLGESPKKEKVRLAVGPEGGWSETDEDRLKEAHFRPARLGDFTLRAETASISAVAICRILLSQETGQD